VPPDTPRDGEQRGLTPAEFAARYRLGQDRVRAMILRGELGALDLAPARLGRPRYVITPTHAAAFERRWAAATQAKPAPRGKKRTQVIDYFPDG
jgi:hypothetical protein